MRSFAIFFIITSLMFNPAVALAGGDLLPYAVGAAAVGLTYGLVNHDNNKFSLRRARLDPSTITAQALAPAQAGATTSSACDKSQAIGALTAQMNALTAAFSAGRMNADQYAKAVAGLNEALARITSFEAGPAAYGGFGAAGGHASPYGGYGAAYGTGYGGGYRSSYTADDQARDWDRWRALRARGP